MNESLKALGTGFKLLWKPGIRLFVLIPFLINLLIYGALLALGVYLFNHLLEQLEVHLPSWLLSIRWVLWFIFIIGFNYLAVYTFTAVANVIAAPFNSLLAERVQQHLTQATLPSTPWQHLIQETSRSLGRALGAILYFIPRALFFLLLFVIPGVNLIAAMAWFLFNSWMMTIQYVDYPAENNRVGFRDMMKVLRQHRISAYSFGALILVGTLIPFLNFLMMPLAVASATALWVDEYAEND